MQDSVGNRCEGEVGLQRRHAGRNGALRVQAAEGDLHQRVGSRNVRRGPLNHRDIGAHLPKRGADVVSRVVRADDDRLLSTVGVWSRVFGRVVLIALEDVHAIDLG